MSIYLIYNLQMARKLKVIVIGAFGSRLLVIPAIILRLVYLSRALQPTDNSYHSVTILLASALICAQIEIGYGIMASTIPSLKPFIAAYDGPSNAAIATAYNLSKLSDSGHTANSTLASTTGKDDHTMSSGKIGVAVRDLGSHFRSDGSKYTANITNGSTSPDASVTTPHPTHWGSRGLSRTGSSSPGQRKNEKHRKHRQRSRRNRDREFESGSFYSSSSSGDESSRRMIIQKKVDWTVTERDRRPSEGGGQAGVSVSGEREFDAIDTSTVEAGESSRHDVIQPIASPVLGDDPVTTHRGWSRLNGNHERDSMGTVLTLPPK